MQTIWVMSKFLRPFYGFDGPWPFQAFAGVRWWLAGVGGCLAAVLFWHAPAWQGWEERGRDAVMRAVASTQSFKPASKVVLVDLSDASIQSLGGWPLPRERIADLVEELVGPLGARMVGLDMVFPEPAGALGDARLASLSEHGPVVMAQVLDTLPRAWPVQVGVPTQGRAPPSSLVEDWPSVRAWSHVASHAGLARARCVGHIGVSLDADGVVRRLSPVVAGPAGPMASLSMAMLNCADMALARETDVGLPVRWRSSTWRVPFVRSLASFESYEASSVLAGQVDPQFIRGKFVLIGSSAVGLSDHVTTPLQVLTPGVLVHAQALAWLLDQGAPWPWDVGRWLSLLWSIGASLLVLWAWNTAKTRVVWLAWLAGAALWLTVLAGLAWTGLFVWPFLAMAVPFLMATCLSLLDWRQSLALRQQAWQTLSRFVAPPVLSQIVQLGLRETLMPRLRVITVMIVDMRDFTQMSQSLSLQDTAQMCREFLELISSPVMTMMGTLDRFSGDGLVAFWGAPLDEPDHARLALDCAQSLRRELLLWNASRVQKGLPVVGMRIGLASGQALVGDFGSSRLSAFTAVGSCFNLASRLQELGRDLQCDLMVDASTVRMSGKAMESLGLVKVKGLRESVEVFTTRSLA